MDPNSNSNILTYLEIDNYRLECEILEIDRTVAELEKEKRKIESELARLETIKADKHS